jgi:hypothetical protein
LSLPVLFSFQSSCHVGMVLLHLVLAHGPLHSLLVTPHPFSLLQAIFFFFRRSRSCKGIYPMSWRQHPRSRSSCFVLSLGTPSCHKIVALAAILLQFLVNSREANLACTCACSYRMLGAKSMGAMVDVRPRDTVQRVTPRKHASRPI